MNPKLFIALAAPWTLLHTPLIVFGQPNQTNHPLSALAEQLERTAAFTGPLVWTGETPPPQGETEELWQALQGLYTNRLASTYPALESFIRSHPRSGWVPSLRANLAQEYFDACRFSLAAGHWEAAWAASKHATEGNLKRVGDFAFAHYVKFLSSLGRRERLAYLFEEVGGRTFERGNLQQMVNSSRERYARMLRDPDLTYKCGLLALNEVARVIPDPGGKARAPINAPSPSMGFSLAKLQDLAERARLNLVAARRPPGSEWVFPAVIHWRQGHYAALLGGTNAVYRIVDSTLGRPQSITAEALESEASGYYLIPAQAAPDWPRLSRAEAGQILGRGAPNSVEDKNDGICNGTNGGGDGNGNGDQDQPMLDAVGGFCSSDGCSGGTGGRSPGAPGGGDNEECGCEGMPRWSVSEPYISLWLHDEPIVYQPAKGPRMSFKLSHHQRSEWPTIAGASSVGGLWHCSWITFVDSWSYGTSPDHYTAGGATRRYLADGDTKEFFSKTSMLPIRDGGGQLLGFLLKKRNGGREYYMQQAATGSRYFFLTEQVDPAGHTNRFIYYGTLGGKLHYVVDPDGRTNTLYYTNSAFSEQITSVVDPFGRTNILQYDAKGFLTSIIDPCGISTSFKYDQATGWITNMVTPYGTTTFAYATNSYAGVDFGGTNINRSVLVTQPDGSKHLYVYRDDSRYLDASATTPFLPYDYTGPQVPTPDTPLGTLDNVVMYYRNSFYWSPRQYSALSTTDMYHFTTNDYNRARLKHWLHDTTLAQTFGLISMQRDPCPDVTGAYLGQITWYDYHGKYSGLPYAPGTNSQPDCIVRVLPNGSQAYVWYTLDPNYRHTAAVSSYSIGDTTYDRTNWYTWSTDGFDLQAIYRPDHTLEWGFGYTNHAVRFATNALSEVTTNSYRADMQLVSIQRPSGLTTTNLYYSSGAYQNWLEKTIDLEIARTNSYAYTNGLVYTHTDERGVITTNTWDNLRRLTSVSDARGTNSYTYQALDLTNVVDRMGYTTWYTHDSLRRLIGMTNALGRYTLYSYCDCGGLSSIRDAAGNYTRFYYNNAGRLTNTVYADGYSVTNHFDLPGRLTNTVDNAGLSTTNYWNTDGLLDAVSNNFGLVKMLYYDLEDRPTTITDANGVTVSITYDALGRVRTRTYPDNGVEKFGYSARGLIAYTNQLGFTNSYVYDPAGRKTLEINANWETNEFRYDSSGNLTNLIDAKNQSTIWKYDQFGRVTNKVDALREIFRYAYDPNNRLTNRWSAAKTNTVYSYDQVGNLTNIAYPISSNIALKYDALNRLTNMVDGIGTTSYAYDAAGQLLSEDGPWSRDTVSYTYQNRRRTGVAVQAPNASDWTQTYAYDPAGRLTNTASPAGAFGYDYAIARLPRKLSLPGNSYITNYYDSTARLLSTALKNSQHSVLNAHQYVYNPGNQRTQQVFTAANTTDYTYDKIGQLKTAKGKEPGGASRIHEQLGYAYDAAGNLNFRTNNALLQTFTVNSLNELSTVSRSGTLTVAGSVSAPATNVTVSGTGLSSGAATLYADNTWARAGASPANGNNNYTATAQDTLGRQDSTTVSAYLPTSATYVYDDNGNLLSDGRRGFQYDDENQLMSITLTNSWRSEFFYDGKMRRRKRIEYTWLNGGWWPTSQTWYIYDGNLVIQERLNGNVPSITYTRGPDLSSTLEGAGGIGALLGRSDNRLLAIGDPSSHAYYAADGNGNIICLANTNGIIVAKYLYDPYGNTLAQSGLLAEANLYRFSSKESHQNSGLVYYLYRYYEASAQRWLNRDPIAEIGGPNLYGFLLNTPLGLIDAIGFDIWITPGLHPQIIGERPGAGCYTIEFTIPPGVVYWFTNPGHYEFHYYTLLPPTALQGFSSRCTRIPTCSAADDFLYGMASRLGQNQDTPRYNLFGYNCQTFAQDFCRTASNLQNLGTPYDPRHSTVNAPPTRISF